MSEELKKGILKPVLAGRFEISNEEAAEIRKDFKKILVEYGFMTAEEAEKLKG